MSSELILIAGVDEVGRGPLAGPVVAAAVILDPRHPIDGLRDSKKLSAEKRDALDLLIKERAIAWAIGEANPTEIDSINIFQASLLAMKRAVDALLIKPTKILVDGKHLPKWDYEAEAIIGGDATEKAISAASIIAKVYRDALMQQMHVLYPHYGFDNHVGYGTPKHLTALKEHGPCLIHRRSFAPVREAEKF